MARLTASWIMNVYYEQLMDRIYLNHHVYPTSIPNYSITGVERAEMSEADALGRELGRALTGDHKETRFYRDPDYCNGIPRRGH